MDMFHLHCDLELNPVFLFILLSNFSYYGEGGATLSVWLLWSMTDVLWYMSFGLSCGVALSFGTF